jgi:hypothetical protein
MFACPFFRAIHPLPYFFNMPTPFCAGPGFFILFGETMSRIPLTCCAASLLALTATSLHAEDLAAGFEDAIKGGSFGGMLRYRADKYDEDNGASEYGLASTLRTSLYYQTKPFHGASGYVELYHIASIGATRYAPEGDPTGAPRDFIIDPIGLGVNQAYGEFKPESPVPFSVKVGRQLFTINDETLVTASRYRQNQNRFDAVTGSVEPVKNLTIEGGQIYHNIDVGDALIPMSTQVGNVAYAFPDKARIAVYGVVLNYKDEGKTDRTTTGARVEGPYKIDDKLSVIYELDYAKQKESGDTKSKIDASMLTARGGVNYDQWYGSIGYRQSSGVNSSSDFAYQSSDIGYPWPWRGNSEQLVFYPTGGLKTIMVWVGGAVPKIDGLSFDLFFFDFKAVENTMKYGSEYITKRWSVYGLATKANQGDDTSTGNGYNSATRLTGMTTFTF